MKRKTNFLFTILFLISILAIGCASTDKNYRDSAGILKTETRSVSGVHK